MQITGANDLAQELRQHGRRSPDKTHGLVVELEYHVLPLGDAIAALNILREAAGAGPWREEGEEGARSRFLHELADDWMGTPTLPPDMTDRYMGQKAYSGYTGQGSGHDLGPRSVLPSKTKWSEQPPHPHRTRVPRPEGAAMFDHTSNSFPFHRKKFMLTVDAQLRADLRNYAVELRQFAYTLLNGVGEHDLLALSGRMRATADQVERQRSVDG